MRFLPLLSLLLVSVVPAACVAGGGGSLDGDGPTSEAAQEILPGDCADACWMIESQICDWESACNQEVYGPKGVVCNHKLLSCQAAELAAGGTAVGLEFCYRECENLH